MTLQVALHQWLLSCWLAEITLDCLPYVAQLSAALVVLQSTYHCSRWCTNKASIIAWCYARVTAMSISNGPLTSRHVITVVGMISYSRSTVGMCLTCGLGTYPTCTAGPSYLLAWLTRHICTSWRDVSGCSVSNAKPPFRCPSFQSRT